MSEDHLYQNAYVYKRLFTNHIKPYLKTIYLAVFFMIIVAGCSAIIVKMVQPTIDGVFIVHDQSMLVFLPLAMVAVSTLKGIAEYYQSYLIKFVGQRILTDLQMLMYESLLKADLAFIQAQSSGRLISRFTNDISLMRGAVSNLLVGLAKHLLSVIFLIFVMFKLEPVLSLLVFVVFPIAIYPVQKLGKRMRKVSHQTQEELGNYTARLDETFQSIKIVKSFLGEDLEAQRARSITNNIFQLYKKAAKFDALTSPIMEILSGIAVGGIIWYGGLMVIEGQTTPGSLFAFLAAFISAYRPFKSLVSLNVNLQEGLAAARRVFQVLDTKPQITDRPNAESIELTKPNITFHNISLNFGKKIALKNIELAIKSGKTTAIVGESGSGKTSLANLLVRFYDPTSGQVLINEDDIRDLTINSLRSQVSLVTQDTILFDTSIAQNIAYGKPGASREEIISAAKSAAADEFITKLPEGYDTIIGNQGSTLSGGQKQRLSIARAFLKDAKILILDEATSALDPKSEQEVLTALNNLRIGRTTLIITHRLSTITNADHIVVMKHGVIAEEGSHKELMAYNGEYFKLYSKELKNTQLAIK